jgi:hypothetical protein
MSDSGVTIDFTDVDEATGYTAMPSGIYLFRVTEPVIGETASDTPIPKLSVRLVGAEGQPIENRPFNRTFTFEAEYAKRVFKNFCASLQDDSGKPIFTPAEVNGQIPLSAFSGDGENPSRIAGALVKADIRRKKFDPKRQKSSYVPLLENKMEDGVLVQYFNDVQVYLPPTGGSLADGIPVASKSRRP